MKLVISKIIYKKKTKFGIEVHFLVCVYEVYRGIPNENFSWKVSFDGWDTGLLNNCYVFIHDEMIIPVQVLRKVYTDHFKTRIISINEI